MTKTTPPLLLLIPGLAGHPTEFDSLLAALGDGRPALAVDVPTGGDVGIDGQASTFWRRARQATGGPLVIIGHSQGGLVALAMAQQDPGGVAGVVVLDSPVQIPRAARRMLRTLLAALPRSLWARALRRFFTATFTEADGPGWRSEVLRRLATTPLPVARTITTATFSHDGDQALRAAAAHGVPVLYVRANIPTRLDHLPPGTSGARVDDRGHWPHVHAPEEVAAPVRRFLADLRVRV